MKRLWGARHIRWAFLAWRFETWWDRYLGAVPNPRELDYLERVWRGEV